MRGLIGVIGEAPSNPSERARAAITAKAHDVSDVQTIKEGYVYDELQRTRMVPPLSGNMFVPTGGLRQPSETAVDEAVEQGSAHGSLLPES